MLILSIDTSLNTCGTAVINGQSVLAEQRIDADSGHGAHLFPLIKKSMSLAHVSFKKLEAIAVTVGPGSFTGLRVGLMTAKTIAYLNKLPVLGVTTLESLAYPVRAEAPLICVMLDALRGDVYFSLFRSQQGQLEPLIDVKLAALQDALTEIVKVITQEGNSCVLMGNTVKEKKTFLKTEIEKKVSTSLIFPLEEYHQVSPAAVAELAQQKHEQGRLPFASALEIHPLYIRKPEAEIVYERKQQEMNYKKQPE